ncbi:pre-mRNA-splicing factor SYF1 isoform X3 [Cynara cardunculus var. scolymus]|uniref:pre-mRNA-splicing factor SYF1 isoform X3 n=1 Tax=Cynara cardunculus var. scolymus TaxID=59895 RepID=UPI000D62395B|nr:pre-mRNA-splicing factor SYF1 isoform X3 [Cynara cardunculus var. scolymus]
MSIPSDLYPSQDDLLYEEELLRNPFSLKLWWRYLIARTESPFKKRAVIYERALKALPGSYKLWHAYLRERLELEAAERLAGVLNDDRFYSIKGKTKHRLWLELCDLLTQHATEISGLNVDAIIRGGIRKFTDEVGRLWTSLADYYIRRKLLEKARDVFEEGMTTVVTVRDFSVIFDAYSQFEESVLALKMEGMSESEDEEEDGEKKSVVEDEEDEEDDRLNVAKLEEKLKRFWLCDEKDVDLRIARLEHLMDRRPELANSVLLRQNPHNVEQWHRRVKIFEGNPTKQILTYTEAVRTIDPMKAVGKPHTLWVAFAKLYESHKDIANARVIFDKAVQVNYKAVDNLASIWCEWAEMELRHKNFKGALELMRRATAEPSAEVKRRVAADGNEPVQIKLHKSLRLWTFYVDLEESLGTLESTRAVYERILDLRIATPQIIINYAMLLEDNKYFEDAFKVYERGVKIFKYPHVKDIWVTYLSKFVKRYGKSKLERARELFEHAVEMAPAEVVKPLYLQYAKLEEDYGLAKRAMRVYDQATKAVPPNEKWSMYEIYIARASEIFGVPKTREIYEQAIVSDGLPERDAMKMCIKYAELEKNLGEIDRARKIYVYASWLADPRTDGDFWNKWHEFEVQHGNEDTFRDMLRIKRSVSARHSQTHVMLPEYLMQKPTVDEAMDQLKKAGVPEDEMAALERQLAPAAPKDLSTKDTGARKLGFVSGGLQSSETASGILNQEEIELPEGSGSDEEDDDGDGKVEIAQKDVPEAVFGGLVRKRDEEAEKDKENGDGGSRLGALERIKRMRQGN